MDFHMSDLNKYTKDTRAHIQRNPLSNYSQAVSGFRHDLIGHRPQPSVTVRRSPDVSRMHEVCFSDSDTSA